MGPAWPGGHVPVWERASFVFCMGGGNILLCRFVFSEILGGAPQPVSIKGARERRVEARLPQRGDAAVPRLPFPHPAEGRRQGMDATPAVPKGGGTGMTCRIAFIRHRRAAAPGASQGVMIGGLEPSSPEAVPAFRTAWNGAANGCHEQGCRFILRNRCGSGLPVWRGQGDGRRLEWHVQGFQRN